MHRLVSGINSLLHSGLLWVWTGCFLFVISHNYIHLYFTNIKRERKLNYSPKYNVVFFLPYVYLIYVKTLGCHPALICDAPFRHIISVQQTDRQTHGHRFMAYIAHCAYATHVCHTAR